jgi:hypothetical protein
MGCLQAYSVMDAQGPGLSCVDEARAIVRLFSAIFVVTSNQLSSYLFTEPISQTQSPKVLLTPRCHPIWTYYTITAHQTRVRVCDAPITRLQRFHTDPDGPYKRVQKRITR